MSEREAFDDLLEQEIPHLRRYALTLTREPTEADDLVQDCLERALNKWNRWQARGRLRGWLFRMMFRTHLNRRRDNRHHASQQSLDSLPVEPSLQGPQESRAECMDTIRAVYCLPEDQRHAILLVAMEDLNYDEAAWILRIPIGTLRSRISRGRQTLRSMCGDQEQPQHDRVTLRRVK